MNKIISGLCFLIILCALLFDKIYDFNICPLCALQRILFAVIGIISLINILVSNYTTKLILHIINQILIIIGTLLAGRHIYLQIYHDSQSCMVPIEYIINNFPILEVLGYILQGTGNCHEINWQLFGLSIPMYALTLFLALGILNVLSIKQDNNNHYNCK